MQGVPYHLNASYLSVWKMYYSLKPVRHSPWNILLCHLTGERTVSERWSHVERTLSERRVNDVWTLNAMWTVNDVRMRKASAMWSLNARWTFFSESLGYFIFLALYLTPNVIRIYMYELLYVVISLDFLYKRTAWNRNHF